MGNKQFKLRHVLVQDKEFPDMWRVLYPNGRLSDLLNYSRAHSLKKENDHEFKPAVVIGRVQPRQRDTVKKTGPRRPSA